MNYLYIIVISYELSICTYLFTLQYMPGASGAGKARRVFYSWNLTAKSAIATEAVHGRPLGRPCCRLPAAAVPEV